MCFFLFLGIGNLSLQAQNFTNNDIVYIQAKGEDLYWQDDNQFKAVLLKPVELSNDQFKWYYQELPDGKCWLKNVETGRFVGSGGLLLTKEGSQYKNKDGAAFKQGTILYRKELQERIFYTTMFNVPEAEVAQMYKDYYEVFKYKDLYNRYNKKVKQVNKDGFASKIYQWDDLKKDARWLVKKPNEMTPPFTPVYNDDETYFIKNKADGKFWTINPYSKKVETKSIELTNDKFKWYLKETAAGVMVLKNKGENLYYNGPHTATTATPTELIFGQQYDALYVERRAQSNGRTNHLEVFETKTFDMEDAYLPNKYVYIMSADGNKFWRTYPGQSKVYLEKLDENNDAFKWYYDRSFEDKCHLRNVANGGDLDMADLMFRKNRSHSSYIQTIDKRLQVLRDASYTPQVNYFYRVSGNHITVLKTTQSNGNTILTTEYKKNAKDKWLNTDSKNAGKAYRFHIYDTESFDATSLPQSIEDESSPASLSSEVLYSLKFTHKNLRISCNSSKTAAVAPVTHADAEMAFKIQAVGDGQYKLLLPNTNLALSTLNCNSGGICGIHFSNYQNQDYQHWEIKKTKDGYYYLKSKVRSKLLGIKTGNVDFLTEVASSHSPALVKFSLQTIDLNAIPTSNYVILKPTKSPQSALVFNGETNGQLAKLGTFNANSQAQVFKVVRLNTGYYKLLKNNRALCVQGAQTTANAPIHLWDYIDNNIGDQDWKFVKVGNAFALVNRHVNMALTLKGNAFVQQKFTASSEQLFSLVSVKPSFVNSNSALNSNHNTLQAALTSNNGNLNLNHTTSIPANFKNAINSMASKWGIDILPALGQLTSVGVKHYEGNSTGLAIDGKTETPYPTTVVSGKTKFLGLEAEVELWLSVAPNKPYTVIYIKFPNLASEMKRVQDFDFFKKIPGFNGVLPGGGVYFEDFKLVFTNFTFQNDVDYGFDWNEGVNILGKIYFNKQNKVNTQNRYLKAVADQLHCDEFKVHLALNVQPSFKILAEVEAITEIPMYPFTSGRYRIENLQVGGDLHKTVVFNEKEKLTVKMVSVGGSMQLDTDESSMELGMTSQVQIAFDEPNGNRKVNKNGQDVAAKTVLQFKGNPKIKVGKTTGFSCAGTLEKVLFSANGVMQSSDNGVNWDNPFGLPQTSLTQAALQMGIEPKPPYLTEIGVAGAGKFLNKSGKFGFLVKVDDPKSTIAMVNINELDALDVAAFTFGGGFFGFAKMNAARAAIPQNFKNFLDKVVDAKAKDVCLSLIGAPGKIGEIAFPQSGITVNGKLDLWGWESYVHMHMDDRNGLAFKSYINPFTWDINGTTVFGLQGNQGNQDKFEVYEYNSSTYTWKSKEISVGDKPHMSCQIPLNTTSNLKMGMHCDVILFNTRIPIDFDLDTKMELEGDFAHSFGNSSINGKVYLSPNKFKLEGGFDLDVPQVSIPAFNIGELRFPEIKIAKFRATFNNSSISIERENVLPSTKIEFGQTNILVNLLGTGNRNITIPAFSISVPLNKLEDLPSLIQDYLKNNADDLFKDLGQAIEKKMFNSAGIGDHKFVFFEGDGCSQAMYAYDEFDRGGEVGINLKKVRPAASIPDNGSSVIFESNLSTKNDEIRSFMVLRGNSWLDIKFYDHPDADTKDANELFRYRDPYFTKTCYTIKGGLAGKVSHIFLREFGPGYISNTYDKSLLLNKNAEQWKYHMRHVGESASGQIISAVYSAFNWDEMPYEIQQQWIALGWSKKIWDEDNSNNYPATNTMKYHQLSTNQQYAVKKLGFSAAHWDD